MGYFSLHLLFLVLLTFIVSVKSQQTGTCFTEEHCIGTTTTGQVDDIIAYCCNYPSLGTRPLGFTYQLQGIEQCMVCPKRFGFFNTTFSEEEASTAYSLPIGYLSGAPPNNFVAIDLRVTGISAGTNDFTVTGAAIGRGTIGLSNGQLSTIVSVQHTIDGIAQENDEQYTIAISNMFNLQDFTFVNATGTIIDTDRARFFFSESDHSKNEGSNLIILAPLSKNGDTRLANPVTFTIFPITIMEAIRRGVAIPAGALLTLDPDSPYEAIEADFNTTSFNVTFPADEGLEIVTGIDIEVDIVDDNINERFEQLFLIGAEVVDAVNPSTVDNFERNVTIGIIVDNDALVIGFNQSSLTFDEPDSISREQIYLVKENNRPTEQRFDVRINLLQITGDIRPATENEDYRLSLIGDTTVRTFLPSDDVVALTLTLFPDDITEGNEGFILDTSPFNDPRYTTPAFGSSLFTTEIIIIRDDDPIIIGFEEPLYRVNESGTVQVCIVVTNPPVDLDLSLTTGQILVGIVEPNTASAPDINPASLFYFVSSSRANNPLSRRFCNTITGRADGILENTEDLNFLLNFNTIPVERIILQPNTTTLEILDQDVATVGFIGAPYSVNENDGTATLTIGVVQGILGVGVTVSLNIQLQAGSAVAPGDYNSTLSSSTITLDSATSRVNVTFSIVDNTIFELTENLFGLLSFAAGDSNSRVILGPARAQVNILDDDTVTFGFRQAVYQVNEAAGTASTTIGLLDGSLGNVGIRLTAGTQPVTSGEVATAGSDYVTTSSNTSQISATNQMASFNVQILPDTITERIESFAARLTGVASVSVGGSPANLSVADRSRILFNPAITRINILDDDMTVIGFSPIAYTAIEDAGPVVFRFGVLSGELGFEVDIDFMTNNGTAFEGADFSVQGLMTRYTLTGTGSTSASVDLVDNSILEAQENFFGLLEFAGAPPANVMLNPSTATATITDNDDVVIGFVPASYTAAEGGVVNFNIEVISGTLTRSVEVEFFTSAGDATAPGDYTSLTMNLTFDASTRSQSVSVTIRNDMLLENAETFFGDLKLSAGTTSSIRLLPSRAIATITDTDAAVIGFTGNYTVTEGGIVNLVLEVFSGSLARDVVLRVSTADGTAQAPNDYSLVSQLVTFISGQTRATIPVNATADDIVEFSEYFTAGASLVSADAAVTISPDTTYVDIKDNNRITVGFAPAAYTVNETAGSVTFIVRILSGSLERPAIVNFVTADGSATSIAPMDFLSQSATFEFNSNTDVRQVSVTIVDDEVVENPESFYGNLSTSDGSVDLAPDAARATILEVSGANVDGDVVIIGFQETSLTVMEGGGPAEVCVVLRLRQSLLERDAVVTIQSFDGTARQPEDYMAILTRVTFSPTSEVVMCRNITITNDAVSEGTQQFIAVLTTMDDSIVVNPDMATIDIEDEDAITIGFVLEVDSIFENAGDLTVFVEVKNNGMLQRDVVVNYTTPLSPQNTATRGVDYIPSSGQLTFTPNNRRLSFTVTIREDAVAEGLEEFILELDTNEPRVTLNIPQMKVDIVDDDVVDIGFFNTTYTGNEVDEFVTLTVGVVKGDLQRDFVVTLTNQDQTLPNAATAPADYQPFSVDLTFSRTTKRIEYNVSLVNDPVTEIREIFLARLQAIAPDLTIASVAPNSAEVFIVDDDRITVGFAPDSYTVNEVDGTATLIVRILNGSLERSADVDFFTNDGTATSVSRVDFLPVSGLNVVFDATTSSRQVTVTIVNDDVVENPEFFYGNLSTTDGAVDLAPAAAIVNILESDGEDSVRIGFDPVGYTVIESQGTAMLILKILDGTLERPVVVFFSTTDGSATSTIPIDFTAVSDQQVVFNPSTSTIQVAVAINNDGILENNERFYGNLSTNDNSVLLSPASTPVTILGAQADTDTVTIGMDETTVEVNENGGTIQLCASVTMGTLERTAVVSVAYQDRGAFNGVDYMGIVVPLTFSPGMTRQCFNVSITNDDNYELTEEFYANLTTTNPNVILMPSFTVVRIIDEDSITIGWEQPRYSVNESIGQVELCAVAVVNGMPSGQIQTNIPSIPITLAAGSATAGSDYAVNSMPSSFSFSRTSGLKLCTMVTIVPDPVFESDEENFFADLSPTTGPRITIDPQRTEVVIIDDDVVTIGFAPITYSIAENGRTVELIVRVISGTLQTSINVQLETKDGSAVSMSDLDYKAESSILSFSTSVMDITTMVDISDDTLDENNENFSAEITLLTGNSERVRISPDMANVIIEDDDVTIIGFESTNYTTTESDTTPVEVCARVMAPPTLARQVVVMVSTRDNTATAASGDYVSLSTNLTFDASTTRHCVNISTPEDGRVEAPEDFVVVLVPVDGDVGVIFSPERTVVTVAESQKVTVRFNQLTYSFNENDGTVTITVDKVGATDLTIMVRVVGGPSNQPNVENSLPGINQVITFQPSETSRTISLALTDDSIALEPVESYVATLEVLDTSIAEVGNPGMTTINVADDDGITIGFGSPNVTVPENVMTFMMCLVVQGDAAVPVLVSLTSQPGTAVPGDDYDPGLIPSPLRIPAGQKRVCFNSSSIVDDTNQEPEESFMLRLLATVPNNPLIVFSPVTTNVIILDNDLSGLRVNDTVIGDPLYTVPISVPEEQLDALNLTKLSLCYEVHGKSEQWFNLVTDDCASVNTRYASLTPRLNIMDAVAVRAVDEANQCVNIRVDVSGCSATVGSSSLGVMNKYESGGIMVKRYSNRVRISVPNCQDLTLVMWVICESRTLDNPDVPGETLTSDMIKFVVMRGLNFGSRLAHGLLGQFWNVPVNVAPYNGLLSDGSPGTGRYIVNITANGMTRAYTGIMHGTTWDHSEGPCLFVGNRQSGPIAEVGDPNDPVIESLYSNYEVKEPFIEDEDYKFGMFDESKCSVSTIIN